MFWPYLASAASHPTFQRVVGSPTCSVQTRVYIFQPDNAFGVTRRIRHPTCDLAHFQASVNCDGSAHAYVPVATFALCIFLCHGARTSMEAVRCISPTASGGLQDRERRGEQAAHKRKKLLIPSIARVGAQVNSIRSNADSSYLHTLIESPN